MPNIDRLFFYYGGHGFVQDGRGLMATYDIEEGRPTLTTLGMGELIEHHSRNIVAHHVLFTPIVSGTILAEGASGDRDIR